MSLFLLVYWLILILWLFGYGWMNWGDVRAMGFGFAQWVLFVLIGVKVYPIALG